VIHVRERVRLARLGEVTVAFVGALGARHLAHELLAANHARAIRFDLTRLARSTRITATSAAILARLLAILDGIAAGGRLALELRTHDALAIARLDARLSVRAGFTVATTIDARLVPVVRVVTAALAEAALVEALPAYAVLGNGARFAVAAGLTNARAVDARFTLFEVENSVVAVCFFVDEAVLGNLACRENGRHERSESESRKPFTRHRPRGA
jgi:hypothetical protein